MIARPMRIEGQVFHPIIVCKGQGMGLEIVHILSSLELTPHTTPHSSLDRNNLKPAL